MRIPCAEVEVCVDHGLVDVCAVWGMGPGAYFSYEDRSTREAIELAWFDERRCVPMSEPCNDSASKDRCLCNSMKAGIRSPGLHRIGLMVLGWWSVEQPRASERVGVVVTVEDMM